MPHGRAAGAGVPAGGPAGRGLTHSPWPAAPGAAQGARYGDQAAGSRATIDPCHGPPPSLVSSRYPNWMTENPEAGAPSTVWAKAPTGGPVSSATPLLPTMSTGGRLVGGAKERVSNRCM